MRIVLRAPRIAAIVPELSLGGMAVSIGLHLFLGAMFVLLASLRSTPPPPRRVYTVSLVADPTPGNGGGSPRAAPSPPPAPVKTEPPPAPVEKPKPVPRPRRTPAAPPERSTPKVPEDAEQQTATEPPEDHAAEGSLPPGAAASTRREPPSIVGEGMGLATGTGGDSQGVPTIDSAAFPFAYYRTILTNRLRSSWSRPLIPGGLNQPIRTTVRFEVLRGGAITEVSVVTSSGHAPLDRSALRAVYDANPLPPLPEGFESNRLAVHFFFELVPER